MSTTSIHDILINFDWNYDDLRLCLENDASSINEMNLWQKVPLQRVLEKEDCSPDIIRLLIRHGADVTVQFKDGLSPLEMVLRSYGRYQKEIIKELLDAGANKFTRQGQSLLCRGFSNFSLEIIRVLIEGDCPLQCDIHGTAVQCFIEHLEIARYHGEIYIEDLLNDEVLKLVTEKCRGLDLNLLDGKGRSLLCYALSQVSGPEVINFMLDMGCLWTACKSHDSPWKCAVEYYDTVPNLSKSLVQMLIKVVGKPNFGDWLGEPLLHHALRYCSYEISAIQLMFESGVVQIGMRSQTGNNAVHAAVLNYNYFKPKIVKWLVDQGADINAVNDEGNTPLHILMNIYFAAVKALLENGTSFNVLHAFGKTLLCVGIDSKCHHDNLQLMLNAGARIGAGKWTFETLSYAIESYTHIQRENSNSCCKLLMKHSLIDDQSIDIDSLIPEESVAEFVNECRDELQRMESIYINPNCTLYQLIDSSSQMDVGAEDYEPPNLNRLTELLVHNQFPVYFDVICARIDREDMEPKLKDIVWYGVKTVIISPKTLVETNIFLNSDTISKIASYLSNEELLKLFIASKILKVE